jgi:glycopeptide antibiotics resistance protein
VNVIITLLKTVAKKLLLKTEDFICAVVTVIFGEYNSVSVIITVLKSVAKKRLLKVEDFYVCCGYSDNWSVIQ